jgi:hypothetical protein
MGLTFPRSPRNGMRGKTDHELWRNRNGYLITKGEIFARDVTILPLRFS